MFWYILQFFFFRYVFGMVLVYLVDFWDIFGMLLYIVKCKYVEYFAYLRIFAIFYVHLVYFYISSVFWSFPVYFWYFVLKKKGLHPVFCYIFSMFYIKLYILVCFCCILTFLVIFGYSLDQGFPNTFLKPPQYCTFCMSPLSDTPISGLGVATNELISSIRCHW